jgi:hypothetical protein
MMYGPRLPRRDGSARSFASGEAICWSGSSPNTASTCAVAALLRSQVSKRSKAARAPHGAGAGVKREKRFAATPGFLAGGQLHGYQVEGVNWLCHAWDRRQHVILADEMGLGAGGRRTCRAPRGPPARPLCRRPLAGRSGVASRR